MRNRSRAWLLVMSMCGKCSLIIVLVLLLAGCSRKPPPAGVTGSGEDPRTLQSVSSGIASVGGESDPEKVRSADFSILFVGNSHTWGHDLPNLVRQMLQFLHPEKKIYAHVLSVGFLEDTANNPSCKLEIESRAYKYVVFQAQKISMSGKFEYSRKEGIDIAKLAKAKGATVFYFSEWGRQGVAEEGPRTERIYQEMAQAAGVGVAPIGRAWDLALAQRPDLPLHSADGNHQSAMGAFLTSCVLTGAIAGSSPAALATFSYPGVDERDRKFLAEMAAKALRQEGNNANRP